MRCEELPPAIAMMGWILEARASLTAKVPSAPEAP